MGGVLDLSQFLGLSGLELPQSCLCGASINFGDMVDDFYNGINNVDDHCNARDPGELERSRGL